MDKAEFRTRFFRAVARLKPLCEPFVLESCSGPDLVWLHPYDNPEGRRPPEGMIKFFGGRHLFPDDVNAISVQRAAQLLWLAGRVPSWVNVYLEAVDQRGTHFWVICSEHLVSADVATLPPDAHAEPGNDLVPFRLRGPQGTMVKDGKLSIAVTEYAGQFHGGARAVLVG